MLTLLRRRGDEAAARALLANTINGFASSSHGIDLDAARAELETLKAPQ